MTITRGRSGPHGKARFLVVLPAAALLSVATAWAQTVEPSPAGQPNPPTSQPPAAADVATSGRWTLRIDAPAELRGLLEDQVATGAVRQEGVALAGQVEG